MVESYDSLIRRAVPRYEEITAALVAFLPQHAGHVLELGSGTGNLSRQLAARYPSATFTFVDAAEEMIQVTRVRLGEEFPGVLKRCRFLVSRFEELQLDGETFDLATSSFSLHHLEHKATVFAALFQALRPAGRLCFADQLRNANEDAHRSIWDRWLAYCREPGNCSEEEIAGLVEHARAHDHYATVAELFGMLEAAGFVEPDCVWRDGMWGVITASTPPDYDI